MALINYFLDNPAVNFSKRDNQKILKDLQANILRHHGKKHALHVFVEFSSTSPLSDQLGWLKNLKLSNAFDQLQDHIFDFEHNTKSPKILTSAYLTYEGFKWLGIEDKRIPGNHNSAFKEGPRWRTRFKKALDQLGKKKVHLMILLAGDNEADLKKKYHEIFKNFRPANAAVAELDGEEKGEWGSCYLQWGAKSENDPLGYKDGISNPIFFPNLKKYPAGKARRIDKPGLALLPDANGASAYSLGSFLSFLKFEIDTETFEQMKKKIASASHKNELTGAMILGRFKNGTPVTLTDNEKMEGLENANYFDYTEWMPDENGRYKDDLDGVRCPHFAHIRKAHPRDPQTYHRRIVRRGVNYEEGKAKGLLFQSFQSDLKEQFEYIVNNWLHAYGNGDTPDPLTFNHERDEKGTTYVFPEWNRTDKQPRKIVIKKTFPTLKAGWYFFAPAISFFKLLEAKGASRKLPSFAKLSKPESKIYAFKPQAIHKEKNKRKI